MRFEEFLASRLADLIRFAVILCGRQATGEALAGAAVRHVYAEHRTITDPDRAYAELRAWVVRGYLSEGMQLGRGPAADVDAPIVDASSVDADWDDLAARFVTSSKLQRAATALYYGEDLPIPQVAAAMGSTVEGIERYLDRVRADLNLDVHTEAGVRALLVGYRDDVDPDVSGLAEALLGTLRAPVRFEFVSPAAAAPAPRHDPAPAPRPSVPLDRHRRTEPPPLQFKPSLAERVQVIEIEPIGADPQAKVHREVRRRERTAQRVRTRRRTTFLAAVVILLVLVALGLVALFGGGSGGPAHAAPGPSVSLAARPSAQAPPSAPRATAMAHRTRPRIGLADLRGSGPATVHLPALGRAPVELHITLRCTGRARATLAGRRLGSCTSFDVTGVRLPAALRVSASRATKWHLAVSAEA